MLPNYVEFSDHDGWLLTIIEKGLVTESYTIIFLIK